MLQLLRVYGLTFYENFLSAQKHCSSGII